jgi:hypothetical protein
VNPPPKKAPSPHPSPPFFPLYLSSQAPQQTSHFSDLTQASLGKSKSKKEETQLLRRADPKTTVPRQPKFPIPSLLLHPPPPLGFHFLFSVSSGKHMIRQGGNSVIRGVCEAIWWIARSRHGGGLTEKEFPFLIGRPDKAGRVFGSGVPIISRA